MQQEQTSKAKQPVQRTHTTYISQLLQCTVSVPGVILQLGFIQMPSNKPAARLLHDTSVPQHGPYYREILFESALLIPTKAPGQVHPGPQSGVTVQHL